MRIELDELKTDLTNAQAIQVFGASSKAKSKEALGVRGERTMIVATSVS
ncbi:MAG: hypothetical protein ACI9KK_000418 [Ascidiaceihabitans sp.]|jgi:hypothetical protein